MKPLGDFETEADHAKRFDVDVRTIRRWRKEPNGGLPFTMAGRTPLLKVAWTLEWLEANRQQRNPEQPRRRRRIA